MGVHQIPVVAHQYEFEPSRQCGQILISYQLINLFIQDNNVTHINSKQNLVFAGYYVGQQLNIFLFITCVFMDITMANLRVHLNDGKKKRKSEGKSANFFAFVLQENILIIFQDFS